MNDFCTKIADILDVESVTGTDVLSNFEEWDSLSVLSAIAMFDANYGVNVTAMELKDVNTVANLWALVQAKRRS
jgi:acyl carrier protein